MGQTTNQIAAHIEDTREDLGSNLRELEQKVKSVTDWNQHFQAHPATMLGVAFGGGVLLATMLGGSKSHRRRGFSSSAASSESLGITDREKHQAMQTWDNIKGALMGVAAARVTDFISDIVPGFRDQFQHPEAKTQGLRDLAPKQNVGASHDRI